MWHDQVDIVLTVLFGKGARNSGGYKIKLGRWNDASVECMHGSARNRQCAQSSVHVLIGHAAETEHTNGVTHHRQGTRHSDVNTRVNALRPSWPLWSIPAGLAYAVSSRRGTSFTKRSTTCQGQPVICSDICTHPTLYAAHLCGCPWTVVS